MQAITTTPAPRYDIYASIHKALRLFMSDTLTRVGNTDPTDATEVIATIVQVRELVDLTEVHITDEDVFIHPAIETVRRGAVHQIAMEHGEHRGNFDALRAMCDVVLATSGAARAGSLARLYHALAQFTAENLEHMAYEETTLNELLWGHYSDADLQALEGQIVSSIPPHTMMTALRWMLPSLNAPERAAMLTGMQAGMPPPAFQGVLELARRTLPAGEFGKLSRALYTADAPLAEA